MTQYIVDKKDLTDVSSVIRKKNALPEGGTLTFPSQFIDNIDNLEKVPTLLYTADVENDDKTLLKVFSVAHVMNAQGMNFMIMQMEIGGVSLPVGGILFIGDAVDDKYTYDWSGMLNYGGALKFTASAQFDGDTLKWEFASNGSSISRNDVTITYVNFLDASYIATHSA